jgi:hypothetical protein
MMCAEDLSKSKGTAVQGPAPLSRNKRRIRDDWVDNNGLVIASNWPSPDTDSVASEVSAGGWLK